MSAPPVLVDRLGRPMASPAQGQVGSVARIAGSHRGTMAGWSPRRHSDASAPHERELIARRAEDLAANDAHAASLIESLSVNSVGTGLAPQSRVEAEALGITEDQAAALREQIEAAFAAWSAEADAGGRMEFPQVQNCDFRAVMVQGEFVNLCVSMANDDGSLPPGRRFAFALQSVHPSRLRTPAMLSLDPSIRDGVALGRFGEARGYWVAQPDSFGRLDFGPLGNATNYPARVGHRPVVLHGFPQRLPEQVRGIPVLAPAMKFFRDLGDCLDAELVGQMVTAQVPMVVTANVNPFLEAGRMQVDDMRRRPEDERIMEVDAGTVLHLYDGEDMKPLDSPRPGNNFDSFVTRILRAAGAAAGLPYEMVVKDFSKTNYSSARAALLEAWRVIRVYQQWFLSSLCRPCWAAVVEEAVARGYVTIPAGAPDFWQADGSPDPRYLACDWIPPRPGHVDPPKEIGADAQAIEAKVATRAEVIASRGGDWESTFRQLKREQDMLCKLGLDAADAGPEAQEPPGVVRPGETDDEPAPSGEPAGSKTAAAYPDILAHADAPGFGRAMLSAVRSFFRKTEVRA